MLICLNSAREKCCLSLSPVQGVALQICSFLDTTRLLSCLNITVGSNPFVSVRLKHKSSPPSLGLSDVPGAGDMLSVSPRNLVISGCSALSGLSAWSLPSKIIENIYGQCGRDHLQEQRLVQNGSDSRGTPRITVVNEFNGAKMLQLFPNFCV